MLVDSLSLLRMVKIWPLFKIFEVLKKREVDTWRIIEVIITYYIACHIVSCVVISVAYDNDDVRKTWMRRIPVPQDTGFRESPTLEGMSDISVYIHSLYFTVNTISHVAIGDITAVTHEERFLNAILILCGTFIYSFLFGNIASIVSDFAPNMFINFHKNYQYVMSHVNKKHIPKQTVQNITNYYDYIWAHSKGINEDIFIKELPDSIRSDILLCRY